MKVVGKYLEYRYGYSSPRYSVRTTMLSLYSLKISYVFIYKISITLLKILTMSWKEHIQSNTKI